MKDMPKYKYILFFVQCLANPSSPRLSASYRLILMNALYQEKENLEKKSTSAGRHLPPFVGVCIFNLNIITSHPHDVSIRATSTYRKMHNAFL